MPISLPSVLKHYLGCFHGSEVGQMWNLIRHCPLASQFVYGSLTGTQYLLEGFSQLIVTTSCFYRAGQCWNVCVHVCTCMHMYTCVPAYHSLTYPTRGLSVWPPKNMHVECIHGEWTTWTDLPPPKLFLRRRKIEIPQHVSWICQRTVHGPSPPSALPTFLLCTLLCWVGRPISHLGQTCFG